MDHIGPKIIDHVSETADPSGKRGGLESLRRHPKGRDPHLMQRPRLRVAVAERDADMVASAMHAECVGNRQLLGAARAQLVRQEENPHRRRGYRSSRTDVAEESVRLPRNRTDLTAE